EHVITEAAASNRVKPGSSASLNSRHRRTMNGNFGYLGRSGLAAWSFELPFPAVDVGLYTASLSESEKVHDAFRGDGVALYRRHGIGSRAHRCGPVALPPGGWRPLQPGHA